MPKSKYDWQMVENTFYEAGHRSKVSLKAISLRFRIPYQTVRRKAADEKWHQNRLFYWYHSHSTKPNKTSLLTLIK
ncbi:hypothetical protein [Fictibacillus sp. S7]|uniref:hypothetical protein n=1 Tax=Fictibacillus sp. S7 TaxID=2212476 RepID=UPI001013343E|nr:hypothetical protein [Fictibacillus sp. S7]RXZ00851.1 hypothetical protein DMO16_14900 [Fictibacillus sp. S7]